MSDDQQVFVRAPGNQPMLDSLGKIILIKPSLRVKLEPDVDLTVLPTCKLERPPATPQKSPTTRSPQTKRVALDFNGKPIRPTSSFVKPEQGCLATLNYVVLQLCRQKQNM